MRRQYFYWAYLVLAIVLSAYGGYAIIYNLNRNKDVPILGIIFFAVGIVMLVVYIVLLIISVIQKKNQPVNEKTEEIKEENIVQPEPEKEPEVVEIEKPTPKVYSKSSDEVEYVRTKSVSRYDVDTAYVRKVGYGPVLRVSGNEILDMRNNTYYHIEGDIVKMDGSGPVFEISGNSIKLAFGGYLYEVSGSNINKVFGGFYASISGNSIQVHDLSERYEISDSLNTRQLLAVVALLFGAY